ncbi:MAG: hypothetical protein R3E89_11770 [Thiolinea sp.]
MNSLSSGEIRMGDACRDPATPAVRCCARLGMAHVPEDRHRMGLVLPFAAYQSAILGYQRAERYNRKVTLNDPYMRGEYAERAGQFDVRPPDPDLQSSNFSGGNQQKIVLAREISADPDILLIGQPTRGGYWRD